MQHKEKNHQWFPFLLFPTIPLFLKLTVWLSFSMVSARVRPRCPWTPRLNFYFRTSSSELAEIPRNSSEFRKRYVWQNSGEFHSILRYSVFGIPIFHASLAGSKKLAILIGSVLFCLCILSTLFCLSCSAHLVLPVPFCVSRFTCPVPPVVLCLSFLPIPHCLSLLSWLFWLACPGWYSMYWLYCLRSLRHSCPDRPALPAQS